MSKGNDTFIHWEQNLQLLDDSDDDDSTGGEQDDVESLHGYPEEVNNNLYQDLVSNVKISEVDNQFLVHYRDGTTAAQGPTRQKCIDKTIKLMSEGVDCLKFTEYSNDSDTDGSIEDVRESQPYNPNMATSTPTSSKCNHSTTSSSSSSNGSSHSSGRAGKRIVTGSKRKLQRSQRSTHTIGSNRETSGSNREGPISPKRLFRNESYEQKLNGSASKGVMGVLSTVFDHEEQIDQQNLLNNSSRNGQQHLTNPSSHTRRQTPPISTLLIGDQAPAAESNDGIISEIHVRSSRESADKKIMENNSQASPTRKRKCNNGMSPIRSPSQNRNHENSMSPKRTSPNGRRKHIPFTNEEKNAVLEGHEKYKNNWVKIREENKAIFGQNERTGVDLKDLHRNLSRQKNRMTPDLDVGVEDTFSRERGQHTGDDNDQLATESRTINQAGPDHDHSTTNNSGMSPPPHFLGLDGNDENSMSQTKSSKKRIPYTEREKLALLDGYKEYGNSWTNIRKAHADIFRENMRTNVNLKDLYRTLLNGKKQKLFGQWKHKIGQGKHKIIQ
jgi:hypothetical protein